MPDFRHSKIHLECWAHHSVTQTDNPALNNHSASLAARFAWILLILATLYICYFHNLGAVGFVGPDEPRYAWIARDMVETGDWVTPRLYGKPWFEKPVLYYWGTALSFRLFGVGEAPARFPSALAALFATLSMAWLALRFYGVETARWLLLLLPTTVGMIGFSHAAATDMPFAAMLAIAMVFAARLLGLVPKSSTSFTSSNSFTSFLFGFFLGLAVLAKGPAAIVLSGGAVLLWAVFTRRWRDSFRCLHPIAIASFCLTALPWYILCARRNPDFFRTFIVEHNFRRYLTPEFQHIQPFWFYVPILLIAFAPWTLALLWTVVIRVVRREHKFQLSPISLFLLSWAIFCLIFFSISKSKLPGYILPAVPAIGLLLARSYVHLVPRNKKSFQWLHFAFGFTISVLSELWLFGSGFAFQPLRINRQMLTSIAWVLLLFALANLLLVLRNISGRPIGLNLFSVVPLLTLVCLFPQISAPWLHYDPSGKTLARELADKQIPLDRLQVANMHRGQEYSLNFYLHRELEAWNKERPQEGLLLISSKLCRHYVSPPLVCSDKPVELASSGWFVYRVERSPSVGGLGTLSGGGSGRNRGDGGGRKPR
jgi:4-amino-4-deoxy-L-arabinose transferase-like glycosyltransferase